MVQPPTGVTFEVTEKSKARVTWNPVDKILLYQVTVSDNDNPENTPVIRNTTATFMDISNLEPCSTYTVGVSSINVFLLPGEASNITHTTSREYMSIISLCLTDLLTGAPQILVLYLKKIITNPESFSALTDYSKKHLMKQNFSAYCTCVWNFRFHFSHHSLLLL